MPVSNKYFVDFKEGEFYHVYNRTNNKELLFRSAENYAYFLQKFHQHLSPFVDLYGWCLLPNHFHFEIKIKEYHNLIEGILAKKEQTSTESKFLQNEISTSVLVENAFKRLFQSYALGFNKMYKRKGNLFYRPFKRLNISGREALIRTLIYIHLNPMKHGCIDDYEAYRWSSWQEFQPQLKVSKIKEEILNWFGGYKNFLTAHRVNQGLSTLKS
jgi:hypothetical protein